MNSKEFHPDARVNPEELPSNSDFWIPSKNWLVYSESCSFKDDINRIQSEYLKTEATFILADGRRTQNVRWVRDMISSKRANAIYAYTDNVSFNNITFSDDIITKNRNISPYITENDAEMHRLRDTRILNVEDTQVNLPGGNIIHCVNRMSREYAIVGELSLVHQTNAYKQSLLDNHRFFKVGSKSANKFQFHEFDEKTDAIKERQRNKQMLAEQLDHDNILVIPNVLFHHIDLELLVLPNGTVIIHSFDEALKLLEANINQIKAEEYTELYDKTKEFQLKLQPLLDKTKRKLQDHGFIVFEACGFLTNFPGTEGIVCSGFNGMPVVLEDGSMLYALAQNEAWFQSYFTNILQKAGVSIIYTLNKDATYIANNGGFFRCQTNNISKEQLHVPCPP